MLVEVTYACKMGCTHCLSDCKPDGEHMTLEVFEDVLKFMIKKSDSNVEFFRWRNV